MNGPKIDKDFFISKGPYLEPFPRILLICFGIYFFLFTSTRAFSQAPLLVFLVGCAFAFAGLNGLRFSVFAVSKDGFKVESYQVSPNTPTPVSPNMLQGDRPEGSEDRSWTPVEINWNTKQNIAGIATTASGETTRPDQISKVYAIKNDVNHLVVFTSDGRALNLDFAQGAGSTNSVGIQ
jgi:hypothetical protein